MADENNLVPQQPFPADDHPHFSASQMSFEATLIKREATIGAIKEWLMYLPEDIKENHFLDIRGRSYSPRMILRAMETSDEFQQKLTEAVELLDSL